RVVSGVTGAVGLVVLAVDRLLDGPAGRVVDRLSANDRDRRVFATANAGGRDDAHLRAGQATNICQQQLASRHLAGDGLADTHGERGWRRAVFHDVEVVVKGSDLENLRRSQAHFPGEGCEVPRAQVSEVVLQFVQMLDQQVAPPRLLAKQSNDVSVCGRLDFS